jgi:hypothetical protein
MENEGKKKNLTHCNSKNIFLKKVADTYWILKMMDTQSSKRNGDELYKQ